MKRNWLPRIDQREVEVRGEETKPARRVARSTSGKLSQFSRPSFERP